MGIQLVANGKEGPHFSVWTEDEGGQGVTEVASALMAFVQSLQTTGGTLRQYLTAKDFFQCIHHKFPEPVTIARHCNLKHPGLPSASP